MVECVFVCNANTLVETSILAEWMRDVVCMTRCAFRVRRFVTNPFVPTESFSAKANPSHSSPLLIPKRSRSIERYSFAIFVFFYLFSAKWIEHLIKSGKTTFFSYAVDTQFRVQTERTNQTITNKQKTKTKMNDYVFMYIFKLLGFNCFRLVYLIFHLMNCDNSPIMQCACTFTETTTRERESSVT